MRGIVQRPGEGEALFGGRIVLKAALPELTVTESWFAEARPGARPHLHHEHADSFYVLEGQMAFLVGGEEHVVGPGATVCAPPGVVHGFRTLAPARFLNFHTPDGRFADSLRERDRGEPGGFDSVDAEPGSGLPASDAVLLHAGEGEALHANHRVATIKIGRPELTLIEFELEPAFGGPDPHTHDDHTDSFYVIEGTAIVTFDGERMVAGPGTFVAATPGVEHTFTSGPGGARLLNVHAPGTGFEERLRAMSRSATAGAGLGTPAEAGVPTTVPGYGAVAP
jgi:quercetin dioxygenase-like cupin family protein